MRGRTKDSDIILGSVNQLCWT